MYVIKCVATLIFNSFFADQFMAGTQVDMEQVHMSIRPLLLKLGDYRSLNLQLIQVSHNNKTLDLLLK